MPKVNIDKPAPNFSIEDFRGKQFSLSNLKGQKNILLIFNRGFL